MSLSGFHKTPEEPKADQPKAAQPKAAQQSNEESKAAFYAKDYWLTPLHMNCSSRIEPSCKTIEALAGRSVNQSSGNGNTGLIYAALMGHEKAVETLLRANANVSHRNNRGDTALHVAANHKIAQALIEAGADTNVRNNDGEPPALRFKR